MVRPLEPGDAPQVRAICVETAWGSSPAGDRIPSPAAWAELVTGYFTEVDSATSWVAELAERAPSLASQAGPPPGGSGHQPSLDPSGRRGGADVGASRFVGGYLLGTMDVRRLERYRWRHLPRALLRTLPGVVAERPSRRAIRSGIAAFLRGELVLPEKVRTRFPATFHLALGAEARGKGLGAILLDHFLSAVRERGVAGVHVQTLSVNEPAIRIIRRAGFQLAAEWPLGSLRRAEDPPLSLLTWIAGL